VGKKIKTDFMLKGNVSLRYVPL